MKSLIGKVVDEIDDNPLPHTDVISVKDDFGNNDSGNKIVLKQPLKLHEEEEENTFGVSMNVDGKLNTYSQNPIQNKVVKTSLDKKMDNDDFLNYSDINNIIYDVFGF
jgi:hypothetical protein